MIEITPAGSRMAADLIAAESGGLRGADALARLCTRFIAMQEDWAAVDRLCCLAVPDWTVRGDIAAIAAKYRVEVGPLVEALTKMGDEYPVENARRIEKLLDDYGYTIGKAKP